MNNVVTRFSNSFRFPQPNADAGGMLIKIYPASPLDRPIEFSGDSVRIGRDDHCEVQLEEDSVSRHHAEIVFEHEAWIVRDLNSTNGTFVNEIQCREGRINSGDRIRFGNQIFKFMTLDGIESKYHEVIFKMMTTDGLTQVYNKRFLQDSLERELQQAQRGLQSVCLLMLDLDKFKSINDRYGHLAGDAVLVEFASRAGSVLRSGEILARYGGEEFSLLCAPASLAEGLTAAERIRQVIANQPVRFHSLEIPVTVSIGAACYAGGAPVRTAELFAQADAMLYRAKQNGRNRIES